MPRFAVLRVYCRKCSIAFMCLTPGFSPNFAELRTTFAMSGCVIFADHMRAPTTSLGGKPCIFASSSGNCGSSYLDNGRSSAASPACLMRCGSPCSLSPLWILDLESRAQIRHKLVHCLDPLLQVLRQRGRVFSREAQAPIPLPNDYWRVCSWLISSSSTRY